MVEFIVILLMFFSTTLFIAILYITTKQKPTKLFPGNNGLPLIGEFLSFIKPYPANSMGHFMEDHISRYGKIFSTNLIGKEAIVSADPEFNRFVQHKDVKYFTITWHPILREMFGQKDKNATGCLQALRKMFGGKSFAFESVERHKILRTTFSEFLSLKRIQSVFLEDTNLLASKIVTSWKDGSIISATQESLKYSLQIIAKATLSIMADDSRMEMLLRHYPYFLSASFSLPIYLPGTKYWKVVKAKRDVIEMVNEIMEQRVNLMSKGCKDEEGREDDFDFLDLLLKKKTEFTKDDIESLIFITLFAGHDTSARTMQFMLYQLAQSPKIVKILQEEHLQIAKSKSKPDYKLSWDDYKNMEFTNCVITESLRLGSVAPFTPKSTTEEVKYKGIVIPRDMLVIVHLRAVHLDPSIYDNPTKFNPWRWMGPTCEKRKASFMPFGGGARICPGENLARLEIAVLLHHIILNFELETVHQDHPICLPYVEFPKGLQLRLHSTKLS